ncbi:hypothetical protein EVAR_65369_1 [Eumeta japonica]|uniref:Uncharacterized protein n=1 Tax=Eumeta variegata TaxID=151549 RepID=A0A4C1ZLL0_EUMVA|nr:hypothetical protein EVAR_65369_1 [Eumeta japonica]
MNPEHHNLNTGGGQPPGNSESQNQRSQASQQGQPNNLPPTTSATDLRVNSASAAVNVALSSVAKYWVFTNLFPSPIPQVSVYGLPTGARIENGKPVQDPLNQSHASILNGDPNIILGHHSSAQTPVSVSTGSGQQLPVSQIIAAQSAQTHESVVGHGQQQELSNQQSSSNSGAQGAVNSGQSSHQQVPNNRVEFVQHHNIDMQSHHSQQHIMQQQLMASARPDHTNQQIQLTVSEDGIVTVVEPGGGGKLVEKDTHHDAGHGKAPPDHGLTVHQLQQIVGQQVPPPFVRLLLTPPGLYPKPF